MPNCLHFPLPEEASLKLRYLNISIEFMACLIPFAPFCFVVASIWWHVRLWRGAFFTDFRLFKFLSAAAARSLQIDHHWPVDCSYGPTDRTCSCVYSKKNVKVEGTFSPTHQLCWRPCLTPMLLGIPGSRSGDHSAPRPREWWLRLPHPMVWRFEEWASSDEVSHACFVEFLICDGAMLSLCVDVEGRLSPHLLRN